jgi:thiol-disulfide isomerase/thioredoxin
MKKSTYLLLLGMIFWHVSANAWKPELNEKPGEITNYEFVDGKPISLADFVGKTVIVYVGGDWCGPCAFTRPVVEKIAKKYENQEVVTIFVSKDDNNLRSAKLKEQVASGTKIALPKPDKCPPGKCATGIRSLGDFGAEFGVPSAFVISKQGLVVARMIAGNGVRDNLESELKKAMAIN